MKDYKVTATGVYGSIFVYGINGPDDSTPHEAVLAAYAKHGQALALGDQDEALGPQNDVQEI